MDDIDDPYKYEDINPLDCMAEDIPEENYADKDQENEDEEMEDDMLMQNMPSYVV